MKKTLLKIILAILCIVTFFIGGTFIIKDICNMSSFSHAFESFCLGLLISSVITVPYIGMIIIGIVDLFTSNGLRLTRRNENSPPRTQRGEL